MAVRCPECGREYDVTLFAFARSLTCECGEEVTFDHEVKHAPESREEEDEKVREIQRHADRISFLITSTDYLRIDIEIEKIKFREKLEELFPDRAHLYQLIYEPRFRRLEEQFREEEDG
jgi:hypothetical protein